MLNRMKNSQYILLVSLCTMMVACGSDDKNESGDKSVKVEVTFTTDVQTRALTEVTTSLTDGKEMTLFVTRRIGSENQTDACKAVCDNGVWKGRPAVELEPGQNASLHAVYPYQQNVNLKEVPIEISSQTDYLFSGSGVAVSHTTPNGKLTMKHALSILSFNIKNDGYDGEGRLRKIVIDGKTFYTEGILNATTGEVKGVKIGAFERACDKVIVQGGWTEDMPDIFCIPFISNGANTEVTFGIDETEYSVRLPEQEVVVGSKYIFALSITNQGLTVFPDQTKKILLNVDTDVMKVDSYGLLKITHTKRIFTLPTLIGEGLNGTVRWGDGTDDYYSSGFVHGYEYERTYDVALDTWGAEEVTIPNLRGIAEIDLSGF